MPLVFARRRSRQLWCTGCSLWRRRVWCSSRAGRTLCSHAPPPRGTFILPVPLSLRPAEGTLSNSCGHCVGYFEGGSSHGVVQRTVGGGQLKYTQSACALLCHLCVVPFSISVCCIKIVLQNKYRNGQERGGLSGKTAWTCLLTRKADFHCCLLLYRNHTLVSHTRMAPI